MKPDTENKITAQFNKLKSRYLTQWEEVGITDTLKKISLAIHALQQAGLDVSIEVVQPTAQHLAFSRHTVFAGNIKSGTTERILIVTLYGREQHIYLSYPLPAADTEKIEMQKKFLISAQSELHDLQELLINDCVCQKIMAECDVAHVFLGNKKIIKPSFHKLPRHD